MSVHFQSNDANNEPCPDSDATFSLHLGIRSRRPPASLAGRYQTEAAWLLAIVLLGCDNEPIKKPMKLRSSPRCESLVQCLQPYAYEELSSQDIKRLTHEGIPKCFSEKLELLRSQISCLPLNMGHDSRVDRAVTLWDACDDVCPGDHAEVSYQPFVSLEICCKSGGLPLTRGSSGRYWDCAPDEYGDPGQNSYKLAKASCNDSKRRPPQSNP